MPYGSVLTLSGNEVKPASDPPLMRSPDKTARIMKLEYIDHRRGTGLTVGSTSTVVFRYIIRRINGNAIVQRNDNGPHPVRRPPLFSQKGEPRRFSGCCKLEGSEGQRDAW